LKDDRVFLAHILDAIQRIESFTAPGHEQFASQTIIQDAVIRNLEVIGEVVKSLSEEMRSHHPDVPWKQIAGMRDVLIHNYFGVKLEAIWRVVVDHLPQLKAKVVQLLEK
jgi:uncharacterized protein with HEPN domain